MVAPGRSVEQPTDTWVFGYGSLVSPPSIARTLEREVVAPGDRSIAVLRGYGRRWNYGSLHLRARWELDGSSVESGIVVSLGLARADESCNGVVVRVSEGELGRLDWRERDYERTDVTSLVSLVSGAGAGWSGQRRVFTYVPRPGAVARYERARDDGCAAVRRDYVELVRQAFGELGPEHLDEYERTTPEPDVPVLDLEVLDTTAPAAHGEAIALDAEVDPADDRRPR
jgi:cation transport regulator ChaC